MTRTTATVFTTFEKLTGNQFVHELGQFFSSIKNWQRALQELTIGVHHLLTGPHCSFVMVTSFDEAKIKEGIAFRRELNRGGYHLSTVIVNRAFPEWMPDTDSEEPNEERYQALANYYKELKNYFSERERTYDKLEENVKGVTIIRIPDFDQEIYSLKALELLAHFFLKES